MLRKLFVTLLLFCFYVSQAWGVVLIQTGGGFACSATGNILEESWDTNPGTDYGGWDADSGTKFSDDNTPPSADGFDTLCGRTLGTSDWHWGAKAETDWGDTEPITYIRFYVYVNAEDLQDGEQVNIVRASEAGVGFTFKLYLKQVATNQLQFLMDWSQSVVADSTYNISLQTSYLVEIYTNNTDNETNWKVNGVAQNPGNGDPAYDIDVVLVGWIDSMAAYGDIYFDNFGVSTSDWLGSCE